MAIMVFVRLNNIIIDKIDSKSRIIILKIYLMPFHFGLARSTRLAYRQA
jgi:hypothetical protein